jgi:transglutaminase-like putative cysteine protease
MFLTFSESDRLFLPGRNRELRDKELVMSDFRGPWFVSLLGTFLAILPCLSAELEAKPRQRRFTFTYSATATGLDPAKKARIWLPVPSSSEEQDVTLVGSDVRGAALATGRTATEDRYGNRIFFVETRPDAAGKVSLSFTYQVTRREVLGETGVKYKEEKARLARYLQPDALVPVTGKPLELIKDRELPDDPMRKARMLYDVVNGHLRYGKDTPGWGRGDSAWACDSKTGNCTDFHSLFISLVRAQKLPAKFEIGFGLPEKRGSGAIAGYHCWAFFRPPGKAWVPVDISEANKDPKRRDYYFGNLTEDRVTFSVGRDIDLVPRQVGKPINFFIYPHVEVDGKEHPQAKIDKKFTFEDRK